MMLKQTSYHRSPRLREVFRAELHGCDDDDDTLIKTIIFHFN